MESNTAHDTELAARLARLDARRQSAGAAPSRQGVEAPSPSATRPGATRTKRRHPARRSRIGVTVGSAVAMVGLTGAMVIAQQSSSAAVTSAATVAATATPGSNASSAALSSNTTAKTATAAVASTTAAKVITKSAGS
jgi:hypothetical protein